MLKMGSNSTINSCYYSLELKLTLCTLLSLTSLFSVVENVLLCAAVRHNKKLHKRSQVLIVNLSVTDLIIAVLLPAFEYGHVFAVPKIFIREIWLHFYKKYMDVFNCSAVHNSFHDSL